MAEPKIVVDKSTVPVGTADKVRARIAEVLAGPRQRSRLRRGLQPGVPQGRRGGRRLHAPRPHHHRHSDTESEDLLRELYAPFNRNHDKIIVMDVRSAELTKYAANCMLATKISFMNEMADLAERLGADIEMVRKGIGSDPRIGYHFIYPGVGYGGSCFPKDVRALIHTARGVGFEPRVLAGGRGAQRRAEGGAVRQDRRHFGGDLAGRTFALWGLAFKPNTDDMREAAAAC